MAAEEHLGAYRRDTGTPVWSETGQRREDGYFELFEGVLAIGDLIYVGRGQSPPGFRVEARTGTLGALQWRWPLESGALKLDISWRFRGAGDTLYVPSPDRLWGVHALDGTQRWHLPYTWGFDAFLAVAAADG